MLGKKKSIAFTDPTPVIVRDDTEELRQKVMGIGYNQWKKMGYSKGTLHQLKAKARKDAPFRIYGVVEEKLKSI